MKRIAAYFTGVVFIFTACTNNQPEDSKPESDLIQITKEQFLTENMEFGVAVHMPFENSIQFTGKIVPDLNGLAKISAPVGGMIKKIHARKGQFVSAGEVILEIGGNTLIDLQQAFTTSSAQMKQLKSDWERTKKLYDENIKTEKEYIRSESTYQSELANYNALKLKLQNIGLNVSDIERGVYASAYKITSPIKGQLAEMNTSLGQFVSSQQDLAEIINSENIQLQLAVFERDYSKIEPGQRLRFSTAGEKKEHSMATITRISEILNANTKSFDCYAELHQVNERSFIINQLVSGRIIIESDSVWAIPENAIITSGNSSFVLILESENDDNFLLDKIKVQVGRISNGFVELKNVPENKRILLSGTYNVRVD